MTDWTQQTKELNDRADEIWSSEHEDLYLNAELGNLLWDDLPNVNVCLCVGCRAVFELCGQIRLDCEVNDENDDENDDDGDNNGGDLVC